jgi:ABC-type antimicrobial peptide transport system permease subunit
VRNLWKAFAKNRLAVVGGVVVLCLIALAVLAPLLAPWDPNRPTCKILSRVAAPLVRHRSARA